MVEDTAPDPQLRAHGSPSTEGLHAALLDLQAAGWIDRVVRAPPDGSQAVQVRTHAPGHACLYATSDRVRLYLLRMPDS